jgi:hypothetical protein
MLGWLIDIIAEVILWVMWALPGMLIVGCAEALKAWWIERPEFLRRKPPDGAYVWFRTGFQLRPPTCYYAECRRPRCPHHHHRLCRQHAGCEQCLDDLRTQVAELEAIVAKHAEADRLWTARSARREQGGTQG